MTRKAIPVRVQVSVAIRQANLGANEYKGFRCPLCHHIIGSADPRILEHMTPHATKIALGEDPDAIENLAWVHEACASRKTNGTKATTAGSDKHMIRKGERIAISRLPKSETEKPLKKQAWRWKRKIGGGVVRVRSK